MQVLAKHAGTNPWQPVSKHKRHLACYHSQSFSPNSVLKNEIWRVKYGSTVQVPSNEANRQQMIRKFWHVKERGQLWWGRAVDWTFPQYRLQGTVSIRTISLLESETKIRIQWKKPIVWAGAPEPMTYWEKSKLKDTKRVVVDVPICSKWEEDNVMEEGSILTFAISNCRVTRYSFSSNLPIKKCQTSGGPLQSAR